MTTFDLSGGDIRALNKALQGRDGNIQTRFSVENPMGQHALAAGCMHEIDVEINGHVGYYCAGMNQNAHIVVNGNAGVGVAENMMSGSVRVRGDASQSAAATAHGGLLVVEGNASARCAISLKGADVVVGGSVGHNSAFMAQAGHLVVVNIQCSHGSRHLHEPPPVCLRASALHAVDSRRSTDVPPRAARMQVTGRHEWLLLECSRACPEAEQAPPFSSGCARSVATKKAPLSGFCPILSRSLMTPVAAMRMRGEPRRNAQAGGQDAGAPEWVT